MFRGWYGIGTGLLTLILGWLVIQPVDFHDQYFIGALALLIIFSLTFIIAGVMTLGVREIKNADGSCYTKKGDTP